MTEPHPTSVAGVMSMWCQKMNTADIATHWRCSEALVVRALHIGLGHQRMLKGPA